MALGGSEEYQALLGGTATQKRIFREQLRTALHAADPKVRVIAQRALADKIAPNLSKSETHETSEQRVLVISDGFADRLLETFDQDQALRAQRQVVELGGEQNGEPGQKVLGAAPQSSEGEE